MKIKLTKNLKKDSGYFMAWQANIAMAIYDEIHKIKKHRSLKKIHLACNEGAKNFLNLLIKDNSAAKPRGEEGE